MNRLSRSPGFTAAAILTLAIALAACITLFSVMDAVVLAPLPFAEPDRLAAPRFSAALLGKFAGGSLFPAMIGLWGCSTAALATGPTRST